MLSPSLGPAGCMQPPRSYSSSRQQHGAHIRERLKLLKLFLRGNLPGISEAADTSRQPHSETFNWEGWEGERRMPGAYTACREQGKELGRSWEGVCSAGAWAVAVAPAKGDAPWAVQAAAMGQSCKSPRIIFASQGKVGRRRQEEKPRGSFQIILAAISPTKAPSVAGQPTPRVQPRVTFVHVEL